MKEGTDMEARSHTGKTAAHIIPCSGDADENMTQHRRRKRKIKAGAKLKAN